MAEIQVKRFLNETDENINKWVEENGVDVVAFNHQITDNSREVMVVYKV